MVKRLILCADNRSPYTEEETYYKYCVGISQVYATKHNIDFIFDELKSVPDGRHWAWARILLFAKYYQKYDEILWLDSDATIINHDVDVFTMLKTAPSSNWIRDESVEPLIYACQDEPDRSKLCTGILLLDCKNKSKVKDMLNDWWNDIPHDKYKQGFPYEQSVVNDVWRIDPVKRNYVKGLGIESFLNISNSQSIIHISKNFYYSSYLQLHEAKKYAAQLKKNYKKRIGIFVRQQNFYASGCGQNCIFIRHSLELLGYKVDLLVENYDQNKSHIITPYTAIRYTNLQSINLEDYEMLIYGSVLPSQPIIDFAKTKRIKRVMFHCMNSMDALHIDTFTYVKKADGVPLFESCFHKIADEVWLANNHEATAKTYLEMLNNYKIPILPLQLTWAPLFVAPDKQPSFYEPRTSKNVEFVIIEPNMSYCKNALYPLMIAEYIHKTQKNVKMVHVFNASTDTSSIANLQIAKENLISFKPRIQINEIVKYFAKGDAHVIFLSHQINCPLNYAYYDILYSKFPFIHNSKMLLEKAQGYYYDTLETAAASVETIISSYKPTTNDYLQSISPGNTDVLTEFHNLLNKNTQKKKVRIVVLTVNQEREQLMRTQLKNLQLRFDVEYYKGFTPETSKEYLASKDKTDLESDGLSCCFRSYAALFDQYKHKEYEYLLTIEDDVLLLSKDFEEHVYKTIDAWNETVEYVNLAYIFSFAPDELTNSERRSNLFFNNLPSNWGTQMMLFKPKTVQKLSQLLHYQTYKEVKTSLETYKDKNKLYRNRTLHVQLDAVLPTVCNQGLVFPPLGIEDPEKSSDVFPGMTNLKQRSQNVLPVNRKDYYS